MTVIAVRYFDGRTSRSREGQLSVTREGEVRILGLDQDRVYRLEALEIAARIGNTARVIRLPDGGSIEASDNDAIDAVLRQQRRGSLRNLPHVLESRARFVVLSLLLSVVALWAGIHYGIPALAKGVAEALPPSVTTELGKGALQALDGTFFERSNLESDRRVQLRTRFTSMTRNLDPGFGFRLEFRRSAAAGPNAFALPDGTIVITDDLVHIVQHEDELVAVIAHEIGHVVGRHAVRSALQNSGVMLLVAGLTGDIVSVSSLAAALPVLLVESRYSRAFETEADDFALAYLQGRRISLEHFNNILSSLERASETRAGAFGYLSSHPATRDRMQRIEKAGAPSR